MRTILILFVTKTPSDWSENLGFVIWESGFSHMVSKYSKVSTITSGCSRLLEFEKKIALVV